MAYVNLISMEQVECAGGGSAIASYSHTMRAHFSLILHDLPS